MTRSPVSKAHSSWPRAARLCRCADSDFASTSPIVVCQAAVVALSAAVPSAAVGSAAVPSVAASATAAPSAPEPRAGTTATVAERSPVPLSATPTMMCRHGGKMTKLPLVGTSLVASATKLDAIVAVGCALLVLMKSRAAQAPMMQMETTSFRHEECRRCRASESRGSSSGPRSMLIWWDWL